MSKHTAPMPNKRCGCCQSPKVAIIDSLLQAGESVRAIAERIGGSPGKSSIAFHAKKCVAPAVARSIAAVQEAAALVIPEGGQRIIPAALQRILASPNTPALAKAIASVEQADDLHGALRLIASEASGIYEAAKANGNLSTSLAALKQVTFALIILAKAKGWISEASGNASAHTQNVFVGLTRDDMTSLREALREDATHDADDPSRDTYDMDPLESTI